MKRILIAVGGSGGHVLPAVALAQQLEGRAQLLFAGHGLGGNRFFQGFEFEEVPAAGRIGLQLLKGVARASGVIGRFRPDLVVGFGSFHAAPVIAAALLRRQKLLLHASDAVAGRVVRWCAPWAEQVTVYFDPTRGVGGRGVPVQMPIRPLELPTEGVGELRQNLGLAPDCFTVLVCGGSQGAQALNQLVPQGLIQAGGPLQVIHLTGHQDRVAAVETIYQSGGVTARVLPFESQMGRLYRAADLAICRSGANSCAELIMSGLPAILIPYPAAMDQHQDVNAALLSDQIGGAVCLEQTQLTAERIGRLVGQLPLSSMRRALEQYRSGLQRPRLDQVIMDLI
jgi:UDP-N-acetylglucosamine--N-acetylmuramyl-(pentapeptide) pyrophosphoryl-undecaprenol N-acetylglucosamine transferase